MKEIQIGEMKHVSGILSVLRHNLIAHQKVEAITLENQGFLIQGFTEEDIKNYISDKKDCLVLTAVDADQVIGYTVGYNAIKLNSDFQEKLSVQSDIIKHIIYSEKTFYHRHIAKKNR